MGDAEKDVKFATGSLKRLAKELRMYGKEVATEEARLQKFKDAGEEGAKIRQQETVVQETRIMIPDLEKKVKGALAKLNKVLEETDAEVDEVAEEVMEAAREAISDANTLVG